MKLMPIIWELEYCRGLSISVFICHLQHVEGTGVDALLKIEQHSYQSHR